MPTEPATKRVVAFFDGQNLFHHAKAAFGYPFAVMRPKIAINSEYVYLAATSSENIEALTHLADGGAYPAVRPEVVSATTVILPCNSILTKFSQITAPMLEKIGQNNTESNTLAAQRDALLPKLLSGEIRVSNMEAHLC